MMVAAVSGAASTDPQSFQIPKVNSQDEAQINPRRPPLLPSEKDNKGNGNPKRPKSRVVSSRYMSPSPSPSASTSTSNSSSVSSTSSSSRWFPSPLVSRNLSTVTNSPALVPKRSLSVDRRRPVAAARPLTPDLDARHSNATEPSAATKLLITATRSLSVSFQGEAFSLPISKTRAASPSRNLSSVKKFTPERRRTSTPSRGKIDGGGDQLEYSKPIDQHRWPGRTREINPSSRSFDSTVGDRNKFIGSRNVIRSLQQSMTDDRRASVDGRFSLDLGNADVSNSGQYVPDDNSLHNQSSNASDLTASDTDSVSSDSTSGMHEGGGTSRAKGGLRGIAFSARFWQETNSRLRRLQDKGSPLSTSPGSRLIVPPKLKKFPSEGTVLSPRTISSPVRGPIRDASPSKLMTSAASSPSRGISSPSRIRNAVSTISGKFSETPSVLSFAVDVRRSKVGENRIADAHLLRLLYNHHMQWRFVNARTQSVLLVQKHIAEKDLWNAFITISDLCDAVTKKRHRLQMLRQKLKLTAILKGQVTYLEDWASLEKDQSISLVGAIEALKASTLRLPIVGGAITDIQSLREAIGSAVDVMQATASATCSLLQKIDEVNAMMAELAKVAAKEQALIEQCKDFLETVAAIEVKDCSLRTHILQHNRLSNCLT